MEELQNKIFEKAFIKQLRLNAGDFKFKKDMTHHFALMKRQGLRNRKFRLTQNRIAQFVELNKLLKEKELAIHQSCKDIERHILTNMKKSKSSYTDYEMEIVLAYYSDKITGQYKKYELDYVYKDCMTLHYVKNEHLPKFERDNNWINFIVPQNRLIFTKLKPCRTLYGLIEFSYLSLRDILTINSIWWDIKVEYQFNNIISLNKNTTTK